MAPRTPKTPADTAAAKPAKAAATAKQAKPAAPKPAKPAAAAKTAGPKADKGTPLKLKSLIDTVAQSTGAKKTAVKPAVEATLAALAAALVAGTDLALPPLGKLRVAKTTGSVLTLKLRLADGSKGAAKPLADDGEDD